MATQQRSLSSVDFMDVNLDISILFDPRSLDMHNLSVVRSVWLLYY